MRITRRQLRRIIREAADSAQRDIVLGIIKDDPGITADEIAAQAGLKPIGPADPDYQVLVDLENHEHAIFRDPEYDGYYVGYGWNDPIAKDYPDPTPR